MQLKQQCNKTLLTLALSAGLLSQAVLSVAGQAAGIGVVNPMPAGGVSRVHVGRTSHRKAPLKAGSHPTGRKPGSSQGRIAAGKTGRNAKSVRAAVRKSSKAAPVRLPQDAIDSLSQSVLAPGVVHKCHRGPLSINLIDVDLNNPDVEVKPVLAGDSFNRLDEVRDQASKVNAIAAVNANYFKKDGTPLGTLVMDGEWVAGPLYDRMSFGITDSGKVHVDRANLHGTIETSNPAVSSIWVNNINQPRRTGSKLVAYTRRWGSEVKMSYPGCLVAVDSSGRVVGKTTQLISVPYGGFVLSDTRYGAISKLKQGDLVFLEWHQRPDSWSDVVQAVSGGPALIKNGKLYVDLKDENFRKTWTSSAIHARTALGVTANRHLILATVEGPHTLWDLAKMLHKLGCVEAMNLDGGGSTTMVVRGNIVTRNKNTFQRRVAASLAVVPRSHAPSLARRRYGNYVPVTDLAAIFDEGNEMEASLLQVPVADPIASEIDRHLLNSESVLPELAQNTDLEGQFHGMRTNEEPVLLDADDADAGSHNKHKKKKKRAHSVSKSIGQSLNKSLEFGWMKSWFGK